MLSWLASFFGGPIVQSILGQVTDAYKAKLAAGNNADKIAADLAGQKLALEAQEATLAQQVNLAEQGRLITALPRAIIEYTVALFFAKVVIWDNMLQWGSTPNLSPNVWSIAMIVITAMFGVQAVRMGISKIWRR